MKLETNWPQTDMSGLQHWEPELLGGSMGQQAAGWGRNVLKPDFYSNSIVRLLNCLQGSSMLKLGLLLL